MARKQGENQPDFDSEDSGNINTRLARLQASLGKRYSMQRATLATYTIYHQDQSKVLEQLKGLSKAIEEVVNAGTSLIFYGSVGTGKDHLMAAMMYQAAQHFPAAWINGQDLYGKMRDIMDSGLSESNFLKSWAGTTVLGISDPCPASVWNANTLYRLVDMRYRAGLATWITINTLSQGELDNMLTPPIADRLSQGAHFFKCCWPSFRTEYKGK